MEATLVTITITTMHFKVVKPRNYGTTQTSPCQKIVHLLIRIQMQLEFLQHLSEFLLVHPSRSFQIHFQECVLHFRESFAEFSAKPPLDVKRQFPLRFQFPGRTRFFTGCGLVHGNAQLVHQPLGAYRAVVFGVVLEPELLELFIVHVEPHFVQHVSELRPEKATWASRIYLRNEVSHFQESARISKQTILRNAQNLIEDSGTSETAFQKFPGRKNGVMWYNNFSRITRLWPCTS